MILCAPQEAVFPLTRICGKMQTRITHNTLRITRQLIATVFIGQGLLRLVLSNVQVATLPELCLSLAFFSLKFLCTQQLNFDVTSANLKGHCTLFLVISLSVKFTESESNFPSQKTTNTDVWCHKGF